MNVSIEHLGATQFRITARKHTIDCDQPVENGGFDEGMTPPELLLASLGACAGYYAAQYLKKQGHTEGGTEVHVSAKKATNPARLAHFLVQVEPPLSLTEEQKIDLEEAVRHCLIHNTLLHPSEIELHVASELGTACGS